MRRLPRALLVVLVVLVILAGGLFLAGHFYLTSDGARRRVVSRLEEAYGGPVEVEQAELGVLGGSTLRGLRLYEPGRPGEAPWATLGTVTADVSALDLLRGVKPKDITLTDPAVTLRLDRKGRLLTHLPQTGQGETTWPAIHVEGGQVTVRQEGRPEMVVRGIKADLRGQGQELSLSGGVKDDYWGEWSIVTGSVDPAAGAVAVNLSTNRADVTQDKLVRLPFVPAAVWNEVKAQGTTMVDFTFRHDPHAAEGGQDHYRVDLDPDDAIITLPTLALHTEKVRGRISVENGVVKLDKVTGRALGGGLYAHGTLDFRGRDSVFDLFVKATGLDVRKLPEPWDFPDALRKFGGVLNGQAQLKVRISDGKATTEGSTGEGKVTAMQVAGGSGEMSLRLEPTPRGLRFIPPAGPRKPGPTGRLHLQSPQRKRGAMLTLAYAAGSDPVPAPAEPEPSVTRGVTAALEGGIHAVGRAVIDAGTKAVGLLPKGDITKPAPATTPPTYLDITLNLKDVDLARLVKDVGVKVPFDVSGRLSMKVRASLPVDRPRDLKAYKVSGTATLPTFNLSGVDMKDVSARVHYDDGVLRLEDVRGQFVGRPAGSFAGSARLGVVPEGDLTADLTLIDIPLTQLVRAAGIREEVTGSVSGSADLRVPAGRLRDLSAWQGSAKLRSERAGAFGWELTAAGATVNIAKGLLTVRDVTGKLEGAAVSGSAEAKLTAPYTYEGKLELPRGDLASLQRLTPGLRPPWTVAGRFGVTAEVNGTLRPFSAKVSGSGAGQDVKLEKVSVNSLHFKWAPAGDVLKLTDIKAGLYGGEVTGSADVPLDPKRDGKVDLRFDDVDVGGLVRDVPAVTLRLEGKAGGSVKGTLKAAPAGGERSFDADVELSSPRLRVQNLPAEKLAGTVRYQKGAGEYHLKGGLLGGTFELDGRIPPRPAKPERPADSRLRLRGAQLGRLGEALGTRGALDDLHGRIDLDLDFRLDALNFLPVGSGEVHLRRLRWGDREIAEAVRGDVVLSAGEIRVRNLSGELGGGTLRGYVALRLREPNRSHFSLAIDGADAARALAPWPALAANVTGTVDARLHGTLGRRWSGGGSVVLSRGKVVGVEVSELRLPLRFDFVPARGRAQIEVEDTSATVARGRVSGRASLGFGVGTHLQGHLRFSGVDLRTALRPLAESATLGGGKASGRVEFSGHDVRSLDDVTATVEASFAQAQAFQLPILSQVAPFIVPGRSSTTFQSGVLRGRLSNGIFRVQRLSLSGDLVRLFAEGNVTTGGRLNLEVTATTQIVGAGAGLLRALGLRVPLAGPVPLSLLLEATGYLSSTSVHLIVSGTVRHPTTRVEPLSLLTDEAARFFLLRAAGPAP
jgi:translocation and assembly module TamB